MQYGFSEWLRDKIVGNAIAPLYAAGHLYESGALTREGLLGHARDAQHAIRGVMDKVLSGDTPEGTVTRSDFLELRGLLAPEWYENPAAIEPFVRRAVELRGLRYEHQAWLDRLVAEPAKQ